MFCRGGFSRRRIAVRVRAAAQALRAHLLLAIHTTGNFCAVIAAARSDKKMQQRDSGSIGLAHRL
jgi:hypothetical protein